MRLVLVRHGATANNAERRFTGQADVALSELGRRQAEALATALAGETFDLIVSSDLARARQTAELIAARHHGQPRLDPDLREVHVGAWEGKVYAEVAAREGALLERWESDPDTPHAPGGGESFAQLRDRAARAIAQVQEAYPAGSVLCVTHGGLIGVLLCHLLGIPLTHRGQFRRDNAAITEVRLGAGPAVLTRLNDICHLRGLDSAEASQVM